MSLTIQQSAFFVADVEIQFRWYFDNADADVARRYRHAIEATILKLQQRPQSGRLRFRNDPDMEGIRCCLIVKPFSRHLLFYRVRGELLILERTIHGARDLPRRLKDAPGTGD